MLYLTCLIRPSPSHICNLRQLRPSRQSNARLVELGQPWKARRKHMTFDLWIAVHTDSFFTISPLVGSTRTDPIASAWRIRRLNSYSATEAFLISSHTTTQAINGSIRAGDLGRLTTFIPLIEQRSLPRRLNTCNDSSCRLPLFHHLSNAASSTMKEKELQVSDNLQFLLLAKTTPPTSKKPRR